MATGLAQTGALGNGRQIFSPTTIAWVDVTGIVAAGLISAAGMFVLPAKRRKLKKEFHDKILDMRGRLLETMRRQFGTELDQMLVRIREAIGPYTRFIRAQREQLTNIQRDLSDVDVDLGRLRADINS
jgi:hypothetical protein